MSILISKQIVKLVNDNFKKIVYLRNDFEQKTDGSYVTKADIFLQSILIKEMTSHFPDHQIISEELKHEDYKWNDNGSYIVIDPIDGTENFISGISAESQTVYQPPPDIPIIEISL